MAFTNEVLAGSIPEIFDNIMRNYGMRFECCIPAVVERYNRAKNLVECIPAINRINTDGKSIPRMKIEVPCWNPYGNDIGINFPLQKGNTGHIIACDRDSTLFKKYLKTKDPQTGDLHKYCHGFFLPDKVHDFVINSDDDGALVLENLSGTTRISIKDNRVKIARQDPEANTNVTAEVNGFQIVLKTPTSHIVTSDDGTVTIHAIQTQIEGSFKVQTGATGIINFSSVATVENGIVTAIS